MAKPPSPNVYMLLPDGASRDALRAGVLALQCVPVNLPQNATERHALLSRLTIVDRVFVFVDISTGTGSGINARTGGVDDVMNSLPLPLRARTVLTRLASGHVSQAERAWVKSLGFCDLIAEFDTLDPEASLRTVLDVMALALDLPLLPAADLVRYVRAVVTGARNTPRSLIRQHTGHSAEQLAQLLGDKLNIQDHSYHLKKYPACLVAADAVAWMAKEMKLTTQTALAIGQALGSLGLLHHVEHKHEFSDERLFFRLALSRQADAIDLGHALKVVHETISIADRTYLGTVYAHCWVGSDAVNVICQKYALSRHASHLVLHRLSQFGLLVHVVNEQPFIDGNYYYRFVNRVLLSAYRPVTWQTA